MARPTISIHAMMLRLYLVLAAALAGHAVQAQDKPAAPPARIDTLKRIYPLRFAGGLSTPSHPVPGITANDILWNDYRTFTDLLSGTPGIFVRDMASPGQDNQVTVTGAGPEGTALLVDGLGHNDPVTGTYNFASFPVEAIDRIELVTGPRAFLYGANASGGAINVVTKSFSNNTPYTRIRYSQSGYSYTQTDVMFSQNILPRFNLSFGMSFLGFGSDKSADRNEGRFVNADNQGYTFRTKVRYNVSETFNLIFSHMYVQAKTGLNGGIDMLATEPANVYDEGTAIVINSDAYEKRSGHQAAVSAAYRPAGDTTLSATVSLFGSQHLREYRDEENRQFPNRFSLAEDFGSAAFGARGQMDWELGNNLFTAIGSLSHTQFDASRYGASFSQSSGTLSLTEELAVAEFLSVAVFARLGNRGGGIADNMGADATLRLGRARPEPAAASHCRNSICRAAPPIPRSKKYSDHPPSSRRRRRPSSGPTRPTRSPRPAPPTRRPTHSRPGSQARAG